MALPNVIPAQEVPFGTVDGQGNVTIHLDWYLFLYNQWSQSSLNSDNGTQLPPSVNEALIEADVSDLNALDAMRRAANVAALQSFNQEGHVAIPWDRIASATQQALESEITVPQPQAQPASPVTVGASPFTFTASFDGALAVSGGTVSAISVIRQTTTVGAGITAGLIPVRRLDKVQITFTAAPTVAFLPS